MIDAKLRGKIERGLDELIEHARKLVDETGVYKRVEENQIRNILEMASSAESVKALEVFVQYQMGRKLPSNFGDGLIEAIEELKKRSIEITSEEPDKQKEVWLTMIRQYLGYLNRYFVYKKKKEGGEIE